MAEYFSHDYDAREDEKIMDLMGVLGWAGYGQYWGVIELLYKNCGKMRTQYERIAFALNTHPDSIKEIVENFGLFIVKNGFFYSKSVNLRLKKRADKSDMARANAYKRWDKVDANAMQSQSKRNAIKDSKVNNSKVNREVYRSFAHLSILNTEVEKLKLPGYTIQQIDSTLDAIENFKGNNKYTSLYLTAKKWLLKEPITSNKKW